ncbi:MAG: hypothetical protein LRY54_01005 [Alphaproteobacteria bacterium]|nr:hypothetical protein [Alphaproteobacteria bacterium]
MQGAAFTGQPQDQQGGYQSPGWIRGGEFGNLFLKKERSTMKHLQKLKYRMRERGNVLFLILIAVALFAALSYAVTSSTRTSSGTTDGETNLINSAQITQYPASVRTAVVRMMINGVAADQLEFNGPNEFSALTDTDPSNPGFKGYGVFHPNGGGATLVTAPPEVMENNQPGVWGFDSYYQVEGIGTTSTGDYSANDIVAFLPGVARAACRRLNEELGITAATDGWDDDTDDKDGIPSAGAITMPEVGTVVDNASTMDQGSNNPGIADNMSGGGTAAFTISGAFKGQAYGCFDAKPGDTTTAGQYVYYHVLLDR